MSDGKAVSKINADRQSFGEVEVRSCVVFAIYQMLLIIDNVLYVATIYVFPFGHIHWKTKITY